MMNKTSLPNTVTQEDIDSLIEGAEISSETVDVFGKPNFRVKMRLKNGWIFTEDSTCIDPECYDEQVGMDICMEKIRNKIWELEGYRLTAARYAAGES